MLKDLIQTIAVEQQDSFLRCPLLKLFAESPEGAQGIVQAARIFFQWELAPQTAEHGEAGSFLPVFALAEQVVLRLGIRGDNVDFLGHRPFLATIGMRDFVPPAAGFREMERQRVLSVQAAQSFQRYPLECLRDEFLQARRDLIAIKPFLVSSCDVRGVAIAEGIPKTEEVIRELIVPPAACRAFPRQCQDGKLALCQSELDEIAQICIGRWLRR